MQKVLLLVVGLIAFALADDVLDLTNGDLNAAIKENEFLLVEFFAPWCGHCKKLAPEYEKAATEVKEEGIVLAKIDATQDSSSAQRYGVRGYPTLVWFKNGAKKDYKGPRDAAGIAAWVRKNSQPTIRNVATAAELTSLLSSSSVVVAAYVADDFEGADDFEKLADSDVLEGVVFAKVAAVAHGDNAGKIVLHRDFDEDIVFETDPWELEAFAKLVSIESFPYFGDAMQSWPRLQATRPIILLACFDVAEDEETMAMGVELAAEFKDSFGSAYANKDLLPRLEGFGLKAEFGVPNAVVISNADGKKYPFPKADQEFNAENLRAWLSGIVDGSVAPYFKSEAIPESNDGPVTVLVGHNFEDIVHAEGKNVLVEFYAPWCGHCKSLAPVYEELGKHYADDEDIVIAKMDSTANDNSAVQVQGFPTLHFFPAGNKEGIKYASGRDLQSFIAFIDKNRVAASAEADAEATGHDEL